MTSESWCGARVDLLSIFAALPRPSKAGAYSVGAAQANWRIGRTFEGHPAMLVSLQTRNGARLHRRLANLEYSPPSPVDIVSATQTQASELAIVACMTHDRDLVSYFFRVVQDVLAPEAQRGDEQRFEAALDAIITLFKSLQRAGTRTVQGLWAELAVIAF